MRLSRGVKWDVGLVSRALNNTNATGRFFPLNLDRGVCAVLIGGAMATTKTTKIELLQATSAAGAGAKGIPADGATQQAVATIASETDVTSGNINCELGQNDDTCTINGIVYTQKAATDATNREFQNAAGLVTCVNHATKGVPGVTAVAAGHDVSLTVDDAGEGLLTIATSAVARLVPSTLQALAVVEAVSNRLDRANGFKYVGVKVTTTANTVVSVFLGRFRSRYRRRQQIAAYGEY